MEGKRKGRMKGLGVLPRGVSWVVLHNSSPNSEVTVTITMAEVYVIYSDLFRCREDSTITQHWQIDAN